VVRINNFILLGFLISSFGTYISIIPVGPVLNLFFLWVIFFSIVEKKIIILPKSYGLDNNLILLMLLFFLVVVITSISKGSMESVFKSIPFFLPILFAYWIGLLKYQNVFRIVKISVLFNFLLLLAITILSDFDFERKKLNLDSIVFNISSNELSLFFISFVMVLYLSVTRYKIKRLLTYSLFSFFYFSKTHVLSVFLGLGFFFSTFKPRLVYLVLVFSVLILGLFYKSYEYIDYYLSINQILNSSVGRLVDAIYIAIGTLLQDDISVDLIENTVGGTRYEIYENSLILIKENFYIGSNKALIRDVLRGYDMHSTYLFLLLNYGIFSLLIYSLILMYYLYVSIRKSFYLLVFFLVYILVRNFSMTIDPIKQLILFNLIFFIQANMSTNQYFLVRKKYFN
jgi:hypothetical protein